MTRLSPGQTIKRPRQTHIMKTGSTPTREDSEKIYKFFVSGEDNSNSQMSDREAATILGRLYGSTPVYHQANGSARGRAGSSSPVANGEKKHIYIRGLGHDIGLKLDRARCDQFVERVSKAHSVAGDAFLSDDFHEVYRRAFTSNPSTSPGGYLLTYSLLALGSMDSPSSSLDNVSDVTRDLFTAASSLVGSAIVECAYVSAVGISAFAHLCFQVGSMLSQGRLCRIAFDILVFLRYHRSANEASTDGTNIALTPKQEEDRVRLFWHVYTVSYYHNMFLGINSDMMSSEKITLRDPQSDDPYDRDYKYLTLKLQLLRAHVALVSSKSSKSISTPQFYEELNAIKVKAKSDFQNGDTTEKMYYVVLLVLLLHVHVSTYHDLEVKTQEDMEAIAHNAIAVIDTVWDFVIAENVYYQGSVWHISHHVFVGCIILIYCLRVSKTYMVTFNEYLEKGIEILTHLEKSVSAAPKWIEVLQTLRTSEAVGSDSSDAVKSYPGIPSFLSSFPDENLSGFENEGFDWLFNYAF